MQERQQGKSIGGYKFNHHRKKLKTDEPDEEKLSGADEMELQTIRRL